MQEIIGSLAEIGTLPKTTLETNGAVDLQPTKANTTARTIREITVWVVVVVVVAGQIENPVLRIGVLATSIPETIGVAVLNPAKASTTARIPQEKIGVGVKERIESTMLEVVAVEEVGRVTDVRTIPGGKMVETMEVGVVLEAEAEAEGEAGVAVMGRVTVRTATIGVEAERMKKLAIHSGSIGPGVGDARQELRSSCFSVRATGTVAIWIGHTENRTEGRGSASL
ncbi:hypothetical protein MMC08_006669 [Hypocenomyce scalaris]|nr:hypothetical protein [Hypocenomyce scalaris]